MPVFAKNKRIQRERVDETTEDNDRISRELGIYVL
jgi:hypothetical protein